MTREMLLASLVETTEADGYFPDPGAGGRYFDWSVQRDGGVELEVGFGDETVQMQLTQDEMAELHKRLTVWLLQR